MIIIPARLQSTRFENKILCELKGLPMFVLTAKNMQEVDDVCIALDDEEVLNIAKKAGIKDDLKAIDASIINEDNVEELVVENDIFGRGRAAPGAKIGIDLRCGHP